MKFIDENNDIFDSPNSMVPTSTDAQQKDEQNWSSVIVIAYIITVPLLIVMCIGVNFLCYKCGIKKGKKIGRMRLGRQYPKDIQDVQRATREQPGPSAGQVSTDAAYDYPAYDEVKEQQQRTQASQRKTPVSQNPNRSLPAVRTDGDGYLSPTSATDNRPAGQSKRSLPSPPGNGGYIYPLPAEPGNGGYIYHLPAESVDVRLVSGTNNKPDTYQNESLSKSSPTSKSIYQSIKDTGISQEHQYIELHTKI